MRSSLLVDQVFQRTGSDRRTVVPRWRGLSQRDQKSNRFASAPLDRLINKIVRRLGLLRDT